jgi:hypothetical protein
MNVFIYQGGYQVLGLKLVITSKSKFQSDKLKNYKELYGEKSKKSLN